MNHDHPTQTLARFAAELGAGSIPFSAHQAKVCMGAVLGLIARIWAMETAATVSDIVPFPQQH